MTPETFNLIIGWALGLIPAALTVLLGYWLQKKNEHRKRKREVLDRRLDQVEKYADLYLELILEYSLYVNKYGAGKPAGTRKIDNPRNTDTTIRNMFMLLNIIEVIDDEKLRLLHYELINERKAQGWDEDRLTEFNSLPYQDQLDALVKKAEQQLTFIQIWNHRIKKRLDFLRASNPDNYYESDTLGEPITWAEYEKQKNKASPPA